ncbi:MAG TPA: hypothetical protein VJC03_01985, partial [bacterium]|nr:hypothetical protein [bacterium]
MLKNLKISGLALIQNVQLELDGGFNVFTGETGAGKTLLLSALNLLIGEKTPSHSQGKDIRISAVFECGRLLAGFLEKWGIEKDGDVVLRREIPSSGAVRNFINDTPVKIQVLKELGELLFDFTTQDEKNALFRPGVHRELLDTYAGLPGEVKKNVKLYREWAALKSENEGLVRTRAQRQKRLSEIDEELGEIESAHIIKGEEDQLRERHDFVISYQKKREIWDRLKNEIYDREGSSYEQIGKMKNLFSGISGKEEKKLMEKVDNLLLLMEDLNDGITQMESRMETPEFDPAELEARLDLIWKLKNRYGDDLRAAVEQRKSENGELSSSKAREEELTVILDGKEKELEKKASEISSARKKSAKELEKKIEEELKTLEMPGVKFEIRFEEIPVASHGKENVEFFIRTNPGSVPAPLRETASGGERSRILLAIKSCLAKAFAVPVVIFDEIDQGLSFKMAG